MGRGVSIDFTLNPRDFIKGLKLIETSTEDVVDALADVGTADVDLDTSKAKKALGDLSGEAKSELGKVETAAAAAGAEVESEIEDGAGQAESAFAKLARGAKSDMGKLETAVKGVDRELGDVEDEANASAKEFGSSFRGDPVEALEEVQSYISEIISVKLPGFAGAAAAVAGGAALGLVVAGVEKWREKQERINEIATDYFSVVQEGVNGPLAATNSAYDDLIDKQIVIKSLEELSAKQMTQLAVLAGARGQTVEQYVNGVLTGEIATQDELLRIVGERNAIAEELLRITRDHNADNDAQIPILQAQDAALLTQAQSLRALGGTLNENVAGYQAAKKAQDTVGAATDAAKEKQRGLNRAAADLGPTIDDNKGRADVLTRALAKSVDKGVTVKVDDSEYERGLIEWVKPAYKKVYVTEEKKDKAAASRQPT